MKFVFFSDAFGVGRPVRERERERERPTTRHIYPLPDEPICTDSAFPIFSEHFSIPGWAFSGVGGFIFSTQFPMITIQSLGEWPFKIMGFFCPREKGYCLGMGEIFFVCT